MIDQTADKPGRGSRPLPLTRTRRPGGPWRALVAGLLILLVIGGVVWIAWPRPATQAARGRFAGTGPMPVAVATAQKGEMPIVLNALGTVTSLATVTVKTQINGQLSQIAFQE